MIHYIEGNVMFCQKNAILISASWTRCSCFLLMNIESTVIVGHGPYSAFSWTCEKLFVFSQCMRSYCGNQLFRTQFTRCSTFTITNMLLPIFKCFIFFPSNSIFLLVAFVLHNTRKNYIIWLWLMFSCTLLTKTFLLVVTSSTWGSEISETSLTSEPEL